MGNIKRMNTLGKKSCLALCLLCAAHFVAAQDSGGSDVDLEKLSETVNVLQGAQDPELTLQSVSTVSGKRLEHRPVFMMESTLDGVLPGLYVDMSQGYPTEQRSLSVRGTTPIILVDGIPRSDVNLPASQIESVSVIKDGLGLSMMGMSSGNGVVYIKTKRGQYSSLKIDFTAQLAFNRQIFRPDFLDSYSWASMLNEALVNDGRQPLYSQTDLELYRTGASPYTHPNVDWQGVLLRNTAPTQQYNLNLSGGGKTARYFIDLNVYDQAGFLNQDNSLNSYQTRENFKKYSLRVNTDISITDHTLLKVGLFGQMFRETTPGKAMMGSIYRDMYTIPNNAFPVFNPDGTLGGTPVYADDNLYGQTILSGYNLYPKTDFNLDISLEHHFQGRLKGLYLSGTYSYNSSYRENLERSKTFAVHSYWKDPTNPNAEEVYQQMASAGAQNNKTSYSRLNRMQYAEFALGYDFHIAKHNFKTKALYAYNDYMVSAKNIPLRKNAFSFRAEYNYDRRFLAEFAMSGMSLNTLKPGHQWGAFPSAGIGWNLHKEKWFNVPAINAMKLRATFGLNGSDGTGAYYRSGTGTLSNYYYNYLKYYSYPSNTNAYFGKTPAGNAILTESNMPYVVQWEKRTRWNAGVDMELFNHSLFVTAEYFHNNYSDGLSIPAGKGSNSVIGMTLPYQNIAKSRRSGLELDLTYNKKWNDFSFTASANATLYWTKILANGENQYPEAYMQRVGEPISQVFGYVCDGFFQNQEEIDQYLDITSIPDYKPQPGDLKYRDLNGDHVLDGKDVTGIGTRGPLVDYGIFLGAEWKGLAFSMQWSGRGNVQTTSKTMPFTSNAQGSYGQALVEHLDYWTPENRDASYPRLSIGNSYNERTSTFWLQNASYLRLKNVEISYTLPQKWTKPIHISGLKFFVNGYNLLTICGIKDRDPELLSFTNGTSSGIIPNTKAYNIGINIQF